MLSLQGPLDGPRWGRPAGPLCRVGALGLARAAITGTEPAVTPGLAEVSSRNRRYSSQRAIDELGYAPKPLAHGIQACWEWYVEHGYV